MTVVEFMRLMERRMPRSYKAGRNAPGEIFAFLGRCVERGLLRAEVGRDGLTRYRPTASLVMTLGDLE